MDRYQHPDFPFLYETHLHTHQGSACANGSGGQMARAAKAAGYTGIFVTDHFIGGNCAVDKSLPWADWVQAFCAGYEDALAAGRRIGLQVFFGWEQSFGGPDFLVYGLDKAWLLANPAIATADLAEHFRMVDAAGGLMIHAHPFREEWYIRGLRLEPELVHGVEVINASHNLRPNGVIFNQRAANYAAHHKLATTSGSDVHTTAMLMGGMAFAQPLTDAHDFVEAITTQRPCFLAG